MRYAACVEYDGTGFSGWQTQKHDVRTVQQTVEAALSKVADKPIAIVTAGRTDSAVHATHQIIHFDSDASRSEFSWCRGANRFLSKDVRVRWVVSVDSEFHARFSALSRSYRFVIYNQSIESALFRNHATHEYRSLDVKAMQLAGQELLGEHDFSSFRAAGCQASSPRRIVRSFEVQRAGDWLWFDVTANAFLQHMVRNIAGALIEIGCAKREPQWIAELLNVCDRTQAGVTATPNGLYLVGVEYAKQYSLPSERNSVSFWGKV